jgi:hypothetical protein
MISVGLLIFRREQIAGSVEIQSSHRSAPAIGDQVEWLVFRTRSFTERFASRVRQKSAETLPSPPCLFPQARSQIIF